mmetsp:Transcript_9066/g.28311  ORF Transcript_9066/g.28311 Transcript_9066/m.28311 type:complete len:317 (-) Transcript_9066:244-1194(-)
MSVFCCNSKDGPGPQDEIRPLTQDEERKRIEKDAQAATSCQKFVASTCCCLGIEDRNNSPEFMVLTDMSAPPSLLQRLCFCQCSPQLRQPTGVDRVPQLRGLAGVTVQAGEHTTSGSLQTLKWGYFDSEKRALELPVFGGCYGTGSTTGLWTEPITPLWCFLMNWGRLANYSYRFEFSEDFRSADIKLKGNPCTVCCVPFSCLACISVPMMSSVSSLPMMSSVAGFSPMISCAAGLSCCLPCMPAWFTCPKCCVDISMRQHADSQDGSHWERYNAQCGGEPKYYYDLLEVFDSTGKPARFVEKLPLEVPRQFMITT